MTWAYENEEKLKSQWMEITSLTIQGNMFRCVQGRPVDSQGNLEERFENNAVMPVDARASSFRFTGPVTVLIGAEDKQGHVTKAAVDVTLRDSFLRVTVEPTGNLAHPRGVFSFGKPETLDFPVFFSSYDNTPRPEAPDGIIQTFKELGFPIDFATPFFARSTTSHPPTQRDRPGYGFELGYTFPSLDARYTSSPDGMSQSFLFGSRADTVLLGGKLSYHGQASLPSKISTGAQTGSELVIEPIFFEIDFRSESDGDLHVTDMHLGNASEGFVASAFANTTSGNLIVQPIPHTSYDVAAGDHQLGTFTATLSSASRPMALLAHNTDDSDATEVLINVNQVSWQNVPFYSDDNLKGLSQNGLLLDSDQPIICSAP
ncbi:MAG TPA: hypothetical protein V6D23_05875 [Candidatus Obscuribacterales bacterium]